MISRSIRGTFLLYQMAHDLPKLPAEFKSLLSWLDRDQEIAVEKYFSIRRGLVKVFEVRGCLDAEELADETIDRVLRRAEELLDSFEGEPAAYFYGVARNVFRESLRRPRSDELPEDLKDPYPNDDGEKERRFQCLDRCLNELSSADRDLIVSYYSFEKGGKSEYRRGIAESLGITMNHLRIRAFRVRDTLHRCIQQCIESAA